MYLDEMEADLADSFGVGSSVRTVSRTLTRSGVTRKKTRVTPCLLMRVQLIGGQHTATLGTHYLVIELPGKHSECEGNGKRASYQQEDKTLTFLSRYSLLPAIANDGILTLQVIPGSVTAELFHDFVEQCLSHMQPYPGPKSVIIMDNCIIHKNQATLDMIIERYEFIAAVLIGEMTRDLAE
ncbi:hypothetical protein FRC09_014819 [Ceratobasidium sp. 395]|nr:hypothetical protein FRC09_014819 [Ceratobasidium sp. 395]